MNVTVPELLQMIGEQQVQIAMLNRELARLTQAQTDREAQTNAPIEPKNFPRVAQLDG